MSISVHEADFMDAAMRSLDASLRVQRSRAASDALTLTLHRKRQFMLVLTAVSC